MAVRYSSVMDNKQKLNAILAYQHIEIHWNSLYMYLERKKINQAINQLFISPQILRVETYMNRQ